ncbi:MAG: CoA pyrophosphatase [Hyphomicrobiaceae bacterium]
MSWTETLFRLRAAAALHPVPQSQPRNLARNNTTIRSDFDLNPDLAFVKDISRAPRHAAVLVPIVAHDILSVLLTERSAHLPSHAGQIAFPGGKVEAYDDGPEDTALRETEEEIGLAGKFIEPLGYLDGYLTGTGFHIVPVVALVKPGFTLQLDSSEVADAFEVPLDFLMNPENHQTHTREWHGHHRSYYAMPYQDRFIWGATAGMLHNLHERLCTR